MLAALSFWSTNRKIERNSFNLPNLWHIWLTQNVLVLENNSNLSTRPNTSRKTVLKMRHSRCWFSIALLVNTVSFLGSPNFVYSKYLCDVINGLHVTTRSSPSYSFFHWQHTNVFHHVAWVAKNENIACSPTFLFWWLIKSTIISVKLSAASLPRLAKRYLKRKEIEVWKQTLKTDFEITDITQMICRARPLASTSSNYWNCCYGFEESFK